MERTVCIMYGISVLNHVVTDLDLLPAVETKTMKTNVKLFHHNHSNFHKICFEHNCRKTIKGDEIWLTYMPQQTNINQYLFF